MTSLVVIMSVLQDASIVKGFGLPEVTSSVFDDESMVCVRVVLHPASLKQRVEAFETDYR